MKKTAPLQTSGLWSFLWAVSEAFRQCLYFLITLGVVDQAHIRKGGLDAVSNLQLLCHPCNAIKDNRSM